MKVALRRSSLVHWAVLVMLIVSAVRVQLELDNRLIRPQASPDILWVRSPALLQRLTLGFNAVWADLYWVRAVQFFGSTRLSTAKDKSYARLYPLLDITTTLDSHFNIAYRLGAILLSENYPNGPGEPEQAIALLEKGLRASPQKWQYMHDIGFVHYWWRRDYKTAAEWFLKADAVPGAAPWMRQVAVTMLAQGGDRETARKLWTEMANNAEHQWMRQAAARGLLQLDAEAHIEVLQPMVNRFYDLNGRFPTAWSELVSAGFIRRAPVDPTGMNYALDPVSGIVDVGPASSLYPLPSR
jgi:TPR repeat protein